MAWPNQDVTDSGNASTLLLSNALASGITSAGALSQLALLQEVVSNLIVNSPPAQVINTTASVTGAAATFTTMVATSLAATGLIKSSSPSAGLGYATGAGTLVTQATNKTTAVVATGVCGGILTNNAAMVNGAEATFTVTNTSIAATDVVVVNHSAGGTSGAYGVFASNIAAGAFDITLTNQSAVSLTEAVTVSFAIIKAVQA